MSDKTGIGWAWIEHNGQQFRGATWNPLRGSVVPGTPSEHSGVSWSCKRTSPACDFCYAATLNKRLGNGLDYLGQDPIHIHEPTLGQVGRWSKPRGVFVCSTTDLFWDPAESHGNGVTDAMIDAVFGAMERATQHVFLVLTKRAERMARYLERRYHGGRVPDHVWTGVTVENQHWAARRMDSLVRINSAVRWVSYEPVLGPVEWRPWATKIDWLIWGGESGLHIEDPRFATRFVVERCDHKEPLSPNPLAVPVVAKMDRATCRLCDGTGWRPTAFGLESARDALAVCRDFNIALYLKQLGGPTPKAAGCRLDGRLYKEFPRPRGTLATQLALV